MPLNEQDARALTYLAMRIRTETHGAGPWDEPGTFANLRKLIGRSLALTAESVIRHAADPKAKSPGVLLGAFTPTALPAETGKRGNPHRDQECPRHPGQWPDTCAGCKTEPIRAYYDEPDDPHPHAKVPHADASLARAMLAQTAAGNCPCGVQPKACPTHREAAVAEEVGND